MTLYVMNDNKNSFDYVIYALQQTLPMCNSLRAEQLALITHHSGESCIYTGFAPEIYMMYAQFQKAGLNVDIREYKPKSK